MKHAFLTFSLALGLVLSATDDGAAHIGSPNVFFTGSAGPYPVRVVIRPPAALPGRAEINITVEADGVRQVSILAAPANVPPETLPPPDVATAVPGAAHLYTAELWIMTQGAYAVQVKVAGSQGDAETVVPLNAVNLVSGAMAKWLQATLALLGVVLVGGAVIITSAAILESALPPGVQPTDRQTRRATIAGGAAAVIMVALIAFGWRAWQQMDRDYRSNQLFKPLPVTGQARVVGADRLLTLARLPDERGNRAWPQLITDHGKLMHTFLLREPQLDAFAHVHPRPSADRFVVAIPPLPGGTYWVYADITQEDGLSQTLTTRVTLPDAPEGATVDPAASDTRFAPDPDDSWHLDARTNTGSDTTTCALQQGYRMIWKNPEVVNHAGESELQFVVVDPKGDPAALVPYMGMLGHAAIRSADGAVFVHLHPTGSISMAAQMLFEQSRPGTRAADSGGESMHAMDHSKHAMGAPDQISFPYAFPRNGPYRIWVQVKVDNTVMTGVFDARVTASAS